MFVFLSRWSFVTLLALVVVFSTGRGNAAAIAQEPVAAADSLFPDPALEAVVRASVFSKRNNHEPLTAEDVADISRIEAANQKIRNLAGLEHCRSLMLVDFTDNEITDLTPLAGLDRLQSVTLAGNRISDLSPLAKLTGIQLLDLSRNEVESLDALEEMKNMRTLYLADNRLHQVSAVANFRKLGALDLAGNRIEDLSPLSNLKWLTTLEISDNRVESLAPLASLADLSMLIMPNNPIESLDPIVTMCVNDANSDRRFAPYLKLYLDLQSDGAAAWQGAIEKLTALGVSVHDYRRPTSSKSPQTP